jgi:hypothetical protein
MSATVLYTSMSLDGFIAGPNQRPDNPLGDDGHRVHEWNTLDPGRTPVAVVGTSVVEPG